ncbi:MAG TPA: FtsQ-type POTRA domain-containing protein [Candidatus Eremiobacteraceae bacterium]|nr:FtsQ-type POTRA domain-containing protein [Candidatus Eremiobacteraceae bacterium]
MAGHSAVRARRRGARAAFVRIVIVLLVVLAFGAAAYAGVRASQDPRLALDRIDVIGCSRSSAADVLAAAALPRGSNIWLLDTGAAVKRIDALPWTHSAEVKRAWPNRVSVTVVERRPAARLDLPTGSGSGEEPVAGHALLDSDMHVLSVGLDDPRDRALPELKVAGLSAAAVGPGADLSKTDVSLAYAAFRTLLEAGLIVRSIDVGGATGIGVETADDFRVLFGAPDGLAQKVQLFRLIVVKITSPRQVAYIDLRSARAPTVLFR